MATIDLLILGLVKNAQSTFPKTKRCLIKTLKSIPNTEVHIFENNSTDHTVKEVNKLVDMYPEQCFLYSEDLMEFIDDNVFIFNYDGQLSRVNILTILRQRMIQSMIPVIKRSNYVLIIDMDGTVWNPQDIHRLMKKNDWDIVFPNGLSYDKYYDTYALHYDDIQHIPALDIEEGLNKHSYTFEDGVYYPVYSAFGGMGLYRSKYFLIPDKTPNEFITYECLPNEKIEQFWYSWMSKRPNHTVTKNAPLITTNSYYINQAFSDHNDIHWKGNSGYHEPILCEHMGFHLQIHNKFPHTRMYIDGSWVTNRDGDMSKIKVNNNYFYKNICIEDLSTQLVILFVLEFILLIIFMYQQMKR